MRKSFKYIGFFAVMLCLFLCASCGKGNGKANVVMVMDVSDSMTTNDGDGYGPYVTNMIPNIFHSFNIPGSKGSAEVNFGVVTFGTAGKREIPLTRLGSEDAQYKQLRDKINDIDFDDESGTDYYEGLDEAIEMCNENKADKNVIILITDGQYNLTGKNAPQEDKKALDEKQKKRVEEFKKKHEGENYVLYLVAINEKGKDESDFDYLMELTDDDKKAVIDISTQAGTQPIADIIGNYVTEIYKYINPDADAVATKIEAKIDGNKCRFSLDKNYKTAEIFIVSGNGKDYNKTTGTDGKERYLHVEKIHAPKDGDFDVRTSDNKYEEKKKSGNIYITENEGFADIYIENAKKGEWEITLDADAEIAATIYVFTPFPFWIVILIAVGVILLVLALMWILCIPPVRYRKKMLPGNISVSQTVNAERTELYSNKMFIELMRTGKYLYHGQCTLGTLLNDKRYKKVVLKYVPEGEFTDEMIRISPQGVNGLTVCDLYDGIETDYRINMLNTVTLTWDI